MSRVPLKNTFVGRNRRVRRVGRWVRSSRPAVRTVAGLNRNAASVLRYHSVSGESSWRGGYVQDSLVVSPEVFERQVAALTKHHRIVGMDEIVAAVRLGSGIDTRAVAITFDDGYRDNYEVAFPILRKYGATATFYVTTGAVGDSEILWTVGLRHAVRNCTGETLTLASLGSSPLDISTEPAKDETIKRISGEIKRRKRHEVESLLAEVHEAAGSRGDDLGRRTMMTWDEIAEMHGSGMGVGAHTVSHLNLPSQDAGDVALEIVASKRVLEARLGSSVEHFAYPDGGTGRHCNARVAKIVAMAGFRSASTSLAGPVSGEHSAYCIPRLGVVPRHADTRRLLADIQYSKCSHQDPRVVDEIDGALPGGGSVSDVDNAGA